MRLQQFSFVLDDYTEISVASAEDYVAQIYTTEPRCEEEDRGIVFCPKRGGTKTEADIHLEWTTRIIERIQMFLKLSERDHDYLALRLPELLPFLGN